MAAASRTCALITLTEARWLKNKIKRNPCQYFKFIPPLWITDLSFKSLTAYVWLHSLLNAPDRSFPAKLNISQLPVYTVHCVPFWNFGSQKPRIPGLDGSPSKRHPTHILDELPNKITPFSTANSLTAWKAVFFITKNATRLKTPAYCESGLLNAMW